MLTVFVNDESVYEFDREMYLEPEQLAFLDKMDNDMDRGIKIQGQLYTAPEIKQRAIFVTMNLLRALQQDNDAVRLASCAYLVNRMPGLVEVRVTDMENGIDIDFVEEH